VLSGDDLAVAGGEGDGELAPAAEAMERRVRRRSDGGDGGEAGMGRIDACVDDADDDAFSCFAGASFCRPDMAGKP
jgi:hypothetical protein